MRNALLTVGTVVALLLVPASAHSASLVLSGQQLSRLGLRPAAASVVAAQGVFASGLSHTQDHLLAEAYAQVAGARGEGQHVLSAAFELSSPAIARSILAAWGNRARARRVTIGDRGELIARGTTIVVVWRRGVRIGLVVVSGARTAASQAVDIAMLEDLRLTAAGTPRTAWERVQEETSPSGGVPLTAALQLLVLAGARLPGVRAPSGPRRPLVDGDGALLPIIRYLPHLRGALRGAAWKLLGLSGTGHAARTASFGDPHFTPNASLTAQATALASTYAKPAYLGVALRAKIIAGVSSSVGTALANALPIDAKGQWVAQDAPICRVEVSPSLGAATPAGYLSYVLAHEVFHCFQFQLDPTASAQGAWLIEGMAEWAAIEVATSCPPNKKWGWQGVYLNSPHQPLFQRTYDAAGFWGHVQETVGLWRTVSAVLNAPTPREAVIAAGADGAAFTTTWGSSFFRLGPSAPAWDIAKPVVVPAALATTQTTSVAGSEVISLDPYTTRQVALQPSQTAPLITIHLNGVHGRFGENENYLDDDLTSRTFCSGTDQECSCPEGEASTVPSLTPLPANPSLGVATLDQPGTVEITYTSPEDGGYCEPSTGNKAWAGGDVHFDGFNKYFTYMGAGEFTLLKSTTGNDLEVQTRQQPYEGSTSIAINTAVAIHVGPTTVEVDKEHQGLSVLVDHRSTHATQLALAGGGALTVRDSAQSDEFSNGGPTAKIQWPDGTTVEVQAGYALGVEITVAPTRQGHLTGLFGGGGRRNTSVGRDGKTYKLTDGPSLSAFAGTWRIAQRESLFTYGTGQSTQSYAIPGFPYQEVASTGAGARAEQDAKVVCRAASITSRPLLAACEYDVAASRNPAFATADARGSLARQITYAVKAHIHGRVELYLFGTSAYWQQLSAATPGLTIINGASWYPVWPEENVDGGFHSSTFTQVAPAVPANATMSYTPVNCQSFCSAKYLGRGRGLLWIEFNADPTKGGAWYEITVTLDASPPAAVARTSRGATSKRLDRRGTPGSR